MGSKQEDAKGGELSMSEKKVANSDTQVVITMPSGETPRKSAEGNDLLGRTSFPPTPHNVSACSCPSPEISKMSPSPKKPPKVPARNETLTRRKSLAKLMSSKPKARFAEETGIVDDVVFEDNYGSNTKEHVGTDSPYGNSVNAVSPNNKPTIFSKMLSSASIASETAKDDEYEIIYKEIDELSKGKRKKVSIKVLIEWIGFVCMVGCLVASLTVNKLKHLSWGLELWKWCLLVIAVVFGMLVTKWCISLIVFLIEMNFLLKKKVLYFVYGLKKSAQMFIWFGLVLLSWVLLIDRTVEQSKVATKIFDSVTWTLVSLLVGTFLWFLKTLLLKILASNFHVSNFFDRIQESMFHQYVLQVLSGPPVIEQAKRVGRSPTAGHFSVRRTDTTGKTKKEFIDVEKLQQMKHEKVSAWTMKVLIDAITSSGLSTISNSLDQNYDYGVSGSTDKEITSEMEAAAAAYRIFRNVAQPGCSYIDEVDLLSFMIKEEVDLVFPLFEGSDTGKIGRKALTNWVVKVYQDRKALAHALNDTKTAVKQLNKLVSALVIVVDVIVWLLLMEIATTKVLVLLSSQIVVAAFIFGNTCKQIFEAIIFVFVMHPFDVGDRCVVDGVPMLVEEMNILTTVFLKLDNEKIFYPNSVLSTKPISNYYRSPDMGDVVEFCFDFTTPIERIGTMKEYIAKYLEKNQQHWQPAHSVIVKEIENVNKIKIGLCVTHTMNFQNFGEKNKRRSELVLELKKILEELNIRYDLLPQAIHLRHFGPETSIPRR